MIKLVACITRNEVELFCMVETFKFEGSRYRVADLSEEGRRLRYVLSFTVQILNEFKGNHAVLMRSKNAYIDDLKGEVIQKKSGVDLGALLADD